jgi:anti-sigma B factor antagonist
MHIKTRFEDGVLTARVEGRLDAHTVDRYIEAVVDGVSADHHHVALDMEAVEFMDSSALAALVTTLRRCLAHGGSVVLVAASAPVQLLLELTRLDEVFPQVDSLLAARTVLTGASSR